ncbi:MAG: toll/interleukin-1 receptor domain-containing protein [Alphaproteobacteria bacterium]|nr:toll/interleukin-1 receptor domain-containing protein [Alphaproteobacteria bacterium]
MTDVFISYAHADSAIAEKLVKVLESCGLKLWWDQDLRSGDRFHDCIEEEIARARFVIVLWSKQALGSDYVRSEMEEAHKHKKLIPLLLDDTPAPMSIANILHLGDLRNWKPCIDDLIARLGVERPTNSHPSFRCLDRDTIDAELNDAINQLAEAQTKLAEQLMSRAATPDQKNDALAILQNAAFLGYAPALFRLSEAYFLGNDIEKDHRKSFALAEAAHAQNLIAATTLLGFHYENGLAVEPNFIIAHKLYSQAAQENERSAMWRLGEMMLTTASGQRDTGTALKLLKQSALLGHAGAMCSLGKIYEEGIGVESDLEVAKSFYEDAWTAGELWGAFFLGRMLLNKVCGRSAEKEARTWFNQITHEIHWATYYLGQLHEQGRGGDENLIAAVNYYRDASDRGNLYAPLALVQLIRRERLSLNDLGTVYDIIFPAVAAGHQEAILELADAYQAGDLIEQSASNARKWFEKASQQGSLIAKWRLAILYDEERGGVHRPGDAARLLLEAGAKGLESAEKASSEGFPDWSTALRVEIQKHLNKELGLTSPTDGEWNSDWSKCLKLYFENFRTVRN